MRITTINIQQLVTQDNFESEITEGLHCGFCFPNRITLHTQFFIIFLVYEYLFARDRCFVRFMVCFRLECVVAMRGSRSECIV